MPKLVVLDGTRRTPELVLHQCLEKTAEGNVENVVVVLLEKGEDGQVYAGVHLSDMTLEDMTFAAKILDLCTNDALREIAGVDTELTNPMSVDDD